MTSTPQRMRTEFWLQAALPAQALRAAGLLLAVLCLGAAQLVAAQVHTPPHRFDAALTSLTQRGGDAAPWRGWMRQEATALRHWTAQPRDNPAWVGGWPHDHADATTGRHLPWTPNTPRPSEALRSGKVAAGWTAINREHNLRQILRAARLAHWLDRPELAQWAAQELDGYASLYSTQPARGRRERSVLFTESLQEATVLPGLLEAIRLLTPLVPPEQAVRWRDELVTPLVQHLMASQHEVSNKSVWRTVGVALAAQQYGRSTWQQWASTGVWSFERQFDTALSPDGFWFELSLQYQAYILRALAEYAIGMQDMGAPSDPHAQAALERMAQATFSQRYPNHEAPLINDSQPGREMPTRDLHALLLQAWPALPVRLPGNTVPSWTAWAAVVAEPASTGPAPSPWPEPATGAQALPGLRSVQWVQGPWRGLLRAGQAAPFHAHQDALSVELMFQDEWVWRNPGTQAYGSTMHRRYFRLAAAHSGPLVNDGGATHWFAQPQAGAAAASSTLGAPGGQEPTSPGAQEPSASAAFHGFQPRTHVGRSLGGSATELTDTLEFVSTGSPAHHGAVFHTPCEVVLRDGSARAPGGSPGNAPGTAPNTVSRNDNTTEPDPEPPAREALAYLKLRYWGMAAGEWRVGLRCGTHRLQARFSASAPLEVWLGNSPGGTVVANPPRSSIYLRMPHAATSQLRVQLTPEARTP